MSGMNEVQQLRFDEAIKKKPFLTLLVNRLLAFRGSIVVCWNEDQCTSEGFVACLMVLGRATAGKSARLRLKGMERSHCHSNAIDLARKYPKRYQREIGYALSRDMWVPHSWIWDIRDSRIVETTCPRDAYFGVTLKVSEAEND
jgi:hypothetical protein